MPYIEEQITEKNIPKIKDDLSKAFSKQGKECLFEPAGDSVYKTPFGEIASFEVWVVDKARNYYLIPILDMEYNRTDFLFVMNDKAYRVIQHWPKTLITVTEENYATPDSHVEQEAARAMEVMLFVGVVKFRLRGRMIMARLASEIIAELIEHNSKVKTREADPLSLNTLLSYIAEVSEDLRSNVDKGDKAYLLYSGKLSNGVEE